MPKVYHRNTPTERICPDCRGDYETVYYAKAGDPESEVYGLCPHCIGGWIRWAPHDPLTLLKDLRRVYLECHGFVGTYRNMRARAMAPVQLPSDHYADPLYREALRDVERAVALSNATLAPIEALFDQMFRPVVRRLAA